MAVSDEDRFMVKVSLDFVWWPEKDSRASLAAQARFLALGSGIGVSVLCSAIKVEEQIFPTVALVFPDGYKISVNADNEDCEMLLRRAGFNGALPCVVESMTVFGP